MLHQLVREPQAIRLERVRAAILVIHVSIGIDQRTVHPCLCRGLYRTRSPNSRNCSGSTVLGDCMVLRALGFGEGNDVAQTIATGQHETEAVETGRQSPMRWRTGVDASSINPKRSRACAAL